MTGREKMSRYEGFVLGIVVCHINIPNFWIRAGIFLAVVIGVGELFNWIRSKLQEE